MDANSGLTDPDMIAFMEDTGLENVLLHKHPNTVPFHTYNRGKKALDMAFRCVQALRLIKKIGILAFYQILPSDH